MEQHSNAKYYKEDVSMNGYGMPALMESDLIQQERDGIVTNTRKDEVDGDGVQVITLSVEDHYGNIDEGAYRAIDPATGKTVMCYFSDSSSVLPADSHTGQVILQAGYMIHGPSRGDCDLVVRQSALIDDLEDMPVQIVLEKQ
ncbi:MAG: hypothetical protein SGILL_006503 [Bacillariaceae sp.]